MSEVYTDPVSVLASRLFTTLYEALIKEYDPLLNSKRLDPDAFITLTDISDALYHCHQIVSRQLGGNYDYDGLCGQGSRWQEKLADVVAEYDVAVKDVNFLSRNMTDLMHILRTCAGRVSEGAEAPFTFDELLEIIKTSKNLEPGWSPADGTPRVMSRLLVDVEEYLENLADRAVIAAVEDDFTESPGYDVAWRYWTGPDKLGYEPWTLDEYLTAAIGTEDTEDIGGTVEQKNELLTELALYQYNIRKRNGGTILDLSSEKSSRSIRYNTVPESEA